MRCEVRVNIRHFPFETGQIASRQPVWAYRFDCWGFDLAAAKTENPNYNDRYGNSWIAFELKTGFPLTWGTTLKEIIEKEKTRMINAIELDNRDIHELIKSAVSRWGPANPASDTEA